MRFELSINLPAIVVVALGLSVFATSPALGQDRGEPPLRTSEPVSDIVADLQQFIPQRIREGQVPGLSIALIRDGEVAWTAGFGVSNVVTRRPVTAETVFEIASNSKVITAYLALRLVEEGELSLDEPLSSRLAEPWLPPSEQAERITLRHLASHSSGLTDQCKIVPVSGRKPSLASSAVRRASMAWPVQVI